MPINFNIGTIILLNIGTTSININSHKKKLKELNENKSSKIICYGYLLSIPIEIVGLMNDGIARMVEILFIFAIVLIPNILKPGNRI